jgi:hypothetical protein
LPLPNIEDKELLQFLTEEKLFWVMTNGYPEFDETQLPLFLDERFLQKTIGKKLESQQGNSIEDQELLRFLN